MKIGVGALVPISLPSAGRITVEAQAGASVLRLVGEIDAETVAAFQREQAPIAQALAAVDLSEVRFLSSSAVSFRIRQTGRSVTVGSYQHFAVSAPPRRVLELIRAMELFTPSL